MEKRLNDLQSSEQKPVGALAERGGSRERGYPQQQVLLTAGGRGKGRGLWLDVFMPQQQRGWGVMGWGVMGWGVMGWGVMGWGVMCTTDSDGGGWGVSCE